MLYMVNWWSYWHFLENVRKKFLSNANSTTRASAGGRRGKEGLRFTLGILPVEFFFLKRCYSSKICFRFEYCFSISSRINKFRIFLTFILMTGRNKHEPPIEQSSCQEVYFRKFVTSFHSDNLINEARSFAFVW